MYPNIQDLYGSQFCFEKEAKTQLFNFSIPKLVWAATWQNQQNEFAPSEHSDQPGLLSSLIRVFAVRMKKSWVLSYPLSTQRRLRSAWASAQSDLSLRCVLSGCPGWSESSLGAHSFCLFCHVAAHIMSDQSSRCALEKTWSSENRTYLF